MTRVHGLRQVEGDAVIITAAGEVKLGLVVPHEVPGDAQPGRDRGKGEAVASLAIKIVPFPAQAGRHCQFFEKGPSVLEEQGGI